VKKRHFIKVYVGESNGSNTGRASRELGASKKGDGARETFEVKVQVMGGGKLVPFNGGNREPESGAYGSGGGRVMKCKEAKCVEQSIVWQHVEVL
jgi:hypothetical protein